MLQLIFAILFNLYLCYSSSVAPFPFKRFNVVPQKTLLSVLEQLPATKTATGVEKCLPLNNGTRQRRKTEIDFHRLLNAQMLLILLGVFA